ncbi:FAD-binding oxidoreductase [Dactylosporangium aurantiacum]|uniref:FAD-binding oxidoreductase n=1 Tax=Dactylosporangium aurantiacum TaxID=35754 RepID=A0A9Q9IG95_9ACTN|nr:FAD-binding oxidoreductase [Dactylosporangium aurantiacum]MDG6104810.1 FAD-binding oxidoreductase [Dactylosporangium aurantiacum]UWZ55634.1 FAD-binding oxidoreductase [Dactylosporangium aurantiacum]
MAAWRERSWWGWGWADSALDDDACRRLAETSLRPWLPIDGSLLPVPDDPVLPAPRLIPPSILREAFAADPVTRAAHTYGKAFRDVARALHGRLDNPPDLVCHPRTGHDVVAALDWAEAAGAAVVPYGGGTSVVGGVEYRGDTPWISLDLSRLNRVGEIDPVDRAVRVQAGVFGPALEQALAPHGLTLRHYPQSFEFSTVGGWLATRSAGHYATGPTRVDDFVEALRVITPQGPVESLRVPGSGAGPSTDRLFLGSEGTLGVIVEAWLRVTDRPARKASTSVAFPGYDQAVAAVRTILQAGLRPSNCRLLDPVEAMLNAGATDGRARLLLGFEGATTGLLADALTICADHGGVPSAPSAGGPSVAAAEVDSWRSSFLRAPYTRDALIRLGLVVETVETACPWSRFEALHAAVTAAAQAAAPARVAVVTCRLTHAYPDGPAPYFTVITPARRGAEVTIWDEIKAAVSEAITANGGTITHHHAVGRDHLPWLARQRDPLVTEVLRAAKRTLDPRGILNPGALLDP